MRLPPSFIPLSLCRLQSKVASTRERANVTATNTLTKDMLARMRFTLEIANLDQLQRVLAMIREVKGVLRAGRR